MKSSQPQEDQYKKVKNILDNLIQALLAYKENTSERLSKMKKSDPLTKNKYEISKDLWANLKEIRSELTEDNANEALEAIKFYYVHAQSSHEKILNDMMSYYILGSIFKNLGYFWGELGKHLDEGTEALKKEFSTGSDLNIKSDQKNESLETRYKKCKSILDDLVLSLFTYKEITWMKLSEANITLDPLMQKKHKISSELWNQLIKLRNQLTVNNCDETFLAIKLHYTNAHQDHEKILNEIISTAYAKYLPKPISGFLDNYLSAFFNSLGSLWSGNLGKELSKYSYNTRKN